MPASNAARSEKMMWIRKNRCECTKIVKVVENNHLRLETSENFKDCYFIFFWGAEPPHQGGSVPLDPHKGRCPLIPLNAARYEM